MVIAYRSNEESLTGLRSRFMAAGLAVSLARSPILPEESTPIALDTYGFAKKLQESGFTPQQVEALLDTVRGVIGEDLATKRDIEHLRSDVLHKIELVRRDTIIWLGSIVVVALTAQSILMKVL